MEHNELILDQFSRQARPFAEKPEHADESVERRLVAFSGVRPTDTVLDVACGPGLVACAFAGVARHVTGIDLTPAMIGLAEARQRELGLTNTTWHLGDVAEMPFADGTFDLVLSRYAFHHLTDPAVVLREMARVTRPGGHVLVVDVAPPAGKAAAYDRAERLRDPSHTRAVPLEAYAALVAGAGLVDCRQDFYRLGMRLEDQIAASFPNPGDADELRALYRADLGRDDLGMAAHELAGAIHFSYPTAAIIGRKPG